LLPDDAPDETETWPALAKDRLADRAVRFGCAAVPGALVAAGLVSLLELEDLRVVLGCVVAFGVACGALAAAYSDRVIKKLLKALEWIG
jgi:hypothetical protein